MSLLELLTTHRHLKCDKGPNWRMFFEKGSQDKNVGYAAVLILNNALYFIRSSYVFLCKILTCKVTAGEQM